MAAHVYGIHELAIMFGMSTEAIRKYEGKRVIEALRDDQNRYRRYTACEFYDLLYARIFRAAGFHLDQTQKMRTTLYPAVILAEIEKHRGEMLSKLEKMLY